MSRRIPLIQLLAEKSAPVQRFNTVESSYRRSILEFLLESVPVYLQDRYNLRFFPYGSGGGVEQIRFPQSGTIERRNQRQIWIREIAQILRDHEGTSGEGSGGTSDTKRRGKVLSPLVNGLRYFVSRIRRVAT
jgi:hypothetical protein